MKTILRSVFALGAVLWSVSGQAGILYDNGSPDQSNGSGVYGEIISADDLLFANDTTVRRMGFYTLESASASVWDGTLLYLVMPDDGGMPDGNFANVLLPFTVAQNVSKVATGVSAFGGAFIEYLYTFDFMTPYTFTGGNTEWLGLYLGSGSDLIFWENTNQRHGNMSYFSNTGGFEANSSDLAFFFVPSPAVILLLPLGLAVMRLTRPRCQP